MTRLLWESLRELGGGERFLAGVGFQDVEQFRFDAGRAVNLAVESGLLDAKILLRMM